MSGVQPDDLNKTIGAILVGVMIALYITSSGNEQGITYLKSTLDEVGWQVGIAFLCLLSSAHTVILCYEVYRYLVTNFGNYEHLGSSEWGFVAHTAIFVFLSLVVQLFYATKISALFSGKRKVALVTVIVMLALAQTGFGGASAYYTATLSSSQNVFQLSLRSQLGWQTLASLMCSALCDALISIAMMMDMRSARFTVRSESFLQVMSRLVIETNLLTTCVAIANLLLNALFHNSGISTAFAIVTPKLYLFSMLVSINRHHNASLAGISSNGLRHRSSLSDMFKGTPLKRTDEKYKQRWATPSKIGLPTLIVPEDSMMQDAPPEQHSPSWFRRTPLELPIAMDHARKEDDSRSISDYGGFNTSIYMATPKPSISSSGKSQETVFNGVMVSSRAGVRFAEHEAASIQDMPVSEVAHGSGVKYGYM